MQTCASHCSWQIDPVFHSHRKGMQFMLFTLSSSLRQESGSCGLYLLLCCVDPGHKTRLKRRFPEPEGLNNTTHLEFFFFFMTARMIASGF